MKRAVLALGLVACSSAKADVTSTTRAAIQGGATDAKDTFAVALLDSADSVCSGTLIAPNLVLTARHCVAEGGGDPIDCAIDRFDAPRPAAMFRVSQKTDASYDTAEYGVTDVLVPKDSLFCGNDLALVVLDANVTSALAEPMLEPPDLDAVTAIGYGTTAPGGDDDGTRRKLASVDVVCVPGIPARDCDLSSYAIAKTEIAAGAGLCEGDSGSGAFIPSSIASGKPVVIGVLSRAADDAGECIDAVYARTDAFRAFLVDGAATAAKAGGYALPSWASPAPPPTSDAGASTPDEPGIETPEADPAPRPSTTTSTTEGGCAASPRSAGNTGLFVLALVPLIIRRRRSHSPV